MTHVVAMALLALSLNQAPNTGRTGAKVKFPPRTEKPRTPPPEEPSQDRPTPASQEDQDPRKPNRDEDTHSNVPQYREPAHLAVIRRNMPQIENCYSRARSGSPALQGDVVVEWEITPGGDVTKAHVTANSTNSSELADCVLQTVKTWTFREPNELYPSHVRHPFRFQSS